MSSVVTPRGTKLNVIDRLNAEHESVLVIAPNSPDAENIKIILTDDNIMDLIYEFVRLKLKHDHIRRSRDGQRS